MNKKIFLFLMVVSLCITSCDLNREPEDTLGDTSFWKTETDLRGACNRLYNLLEGFSHDSRSDELVKTSADDISSGKLTVPATSGNWSDPYYRIFTANNIIQKGSGANVVESIKNRYLAEAYFFRAYYYFMLVKK